MADLNKFEEMLERLVNEDKAGAEELFHEIVVEKSREIYENILESDLDDEEVDEATDEEVDESDDDEEVDEGFNLDEFEVEADPMADMGGDPADDMMAMVGADDEGSEEPEMDMDSEEGEGDMEDRIEDLEDAFKELQAEFDAMMDGDEAPADDEGDMDMDMDAGDEEDDEEGEEEPEEAVAFESDDEEVEEKSKEPKSAGETMREYVEKVTAKMGDTGTNGTKSAVAGKNDMGGTASNIAQSDTGDVAEAGAGSTVKGSALSDTSAKEDNAGNINVPGGKAAKAGKTEGAGHGAEKKGKPETADNKTSVVGK